MDENRRDASEGRSAVHVPTNSIDGMSCPLNCTQRAKPSVVACILKQNLRSGVWTYICKCSSCVHTHTRLQHARSSVSTRLRTNSRSLTNYFLLNRQSNYKLAYKTKFKLSTLPLQTKNSLKRVFYNRWRDLLISKCDRAPQGKVFQPFWV